MPGHPLSYSSEPFVQIGEYAEDKITLVQYRFQRVEKKQQKCSLNTAKQQNETLGHRYQRILWIEIKARPKLTGDF